VKHHDYGAIFGAIVWSSIQGSLLLVREIGLQLRFHSSLHHSGRRCALAFIAGLKEMMPGSRHVGSNRLWQGNVYSRKTAGVIGNFHLFASMSALAIAH
jgi:hypothetical protein